jgi:hypothetical protein
MNDVSAKIHTWRLVDQLSNCKYMHVISIFSPKHDCAKCPHQGPTRHILSASRQNWVRSALRNSGVSFSLDTTNCNSSNHICTKPCPGSTSFTRYFLSWPHDSCADSATSESQGHRSPVMRACLKYQREEVTGRACRTQLLAPMNCECTSRALVCICLQGQEQIELTKQAQSSREVRLWPTPQK